MSNFNLQATLDLAAKHSVMKYLARDLGTSCNMLRYNLMKAHKLESVKKILLENKEKNGK